MVFRILGDKRSGNCLKVLYVSTHLGLEFEWVDVDIMAAQTHTEEFLARNPAGQIPVVQLDDGRCLSQSNAIMLYLANGSRLVPEDDWLRAELYQWLFWEQYSHEPTIAVCRFKCIYEGLAQSDLDPTLVAKGNRALDLMTAHLEQATWMVGEELSLADISLVAYTRLAADGGFDLHGRAPLERWIARVEHALDI